MNRIFLQQDSRDIHFPVGAVPIIPDSIEFDRGISNVVESPASVECTAISAADVCANQTGVVYSYDDLWSWTPHTEEGATPQDSMGALIKHGLLPVSNDVRDARWKSYFRAEGNSGDYFETTRVSMMSAQSPTTCATNFYSEWLDVPDDGVLPIGQTRISGHDWSVTGWRTIPTGLQSSLQFHVKFWTGGFRWMPKEVFNNEMHKYGTTAFIPTSQTVLYNSTRTLIQWIKDFCVNIGLSLKQNSVSLPPNPAPMQPTTTESKGQKLYDIAMSLKGQYLTLDPTVPKALNCAETISYILKQAGYTMPEKGFAGTVAIASWLESNFTEIDAPELYCIMVALTQGDNHGHIWINGHDAMLSNDSPTGLLESYWSLAGAQEFYGKNKGLVIKYFRAI